MFRSGSATALPDPDGIMDGTRYARLFAGALFLLLPGLAAAQQISVVKNADLNFGSFGTSASPGTAVLNPTTGVVTVTGGVVNLGGTQTAASFTVTVPKAGRSYTIVLPTSATLTGPGAATMTVNTFRSNPTTGRVNSGTRTQIVTVGATLRISANQSPGNYSGTATFIVTHP